MKIVNQTSLKALESYKDVALRHIPWSTLQRWGHHRGTHVLCALVKEIDAKTFVEVGSQTGLQSFVLTQEFPDLKVVAIDINPTTGPFPGPKTFLEVTASSNKAVNSFRDNELCVVYIDADHSYDAVISDLRSWYPKVRRGGILSGHDYNQPTHPGVKQAVDEFLRDSGCVLNLTDYYNWWTIKK